jgi:hypothetical protein
MPSTRTRVPAHTDRETNAKIRRDAELRVEFLAEHPAEIPARLKALDEEWDIERAIECNASALAFTGVLLSASSDDKRWLILPAMVTGFLFQHAVQGWCPPVPILRRLGFRTAYEIEEEHQALKALRGDFANASTPQAAMQAARA